MRGLNINREKRSGRPWERIGTLPRMHLLFRAPPCLSLKHELQLFTTYMPPDHQVRLPWKGLVQNDSHTLAGLAGHAFISLSAPTGWLIMLIKDDPITADNRDLACAPAVTAAIRDE
jgi:hypothetical protein